MRLLLAVVLAIPPGLDLYVLAPEENPITPTLSSEPPAGFPRPWHSSRSLPRRRHNK